MADNIWADWVENKKAAINTIIKTRSSCSIKSWRIGKHSERITKIKPFINKYNWEGINFPSEKCDWKKFEKNNLKTALNVLMLKQEKYILPISNREDQVILLMILNREGWHYLALKNYQHY